MMNKKNLLLLILIWCLLSCRNQEVDSKIWLHRANDLVAMQIGEHNYKGMEIDIHFNDSLQTLIVKHDYEDTTILLLDEWLSHLQNTNMGLWLDLKNLTPENKYSIVKELTSLRQKYHLRKKIYVESSNYADLDIFAKKYFLTSYYTPWFNESSTEAELTQARLEISDAIACPWIKAISGRYFQYEKMKEWFPRQKKLLWYIGCDTTLRNDYISIALQDKTIDVLLVSDEACD